eukprot:COSAG01_NODE_3151_length_6502_cov_6.673903_6_plen_317_part_00
MNEARCVGSCDLHFKTLLTCAHNSTSTIAHIRQYLQLLVALSLAAVLSCPLRELLVQLEGDAAHAHHLRRGGALSEQNRSRGFELVTRRIYKRASDFLSLTSADLERFLNALCRPDWVWKTTVTLLRCSRPASELSAAEARPRGAASLGATTQGTGSATNRMLFSGRAHTRSATPHSNCNVDCDRCSSPSWNRGCRCPATLCSTRTRKSVSPTNLTLEEDLRLPRDDPWRASFRNALPPSTGQSSANAGAPAPVRFLRRHNQPPPARAITKHAGVRAPQVRGYVLSVATPKLCSWIGCLWGPRATHEIHPAMPSSA